MAQRPPCSFKKGMKMTQGKDWWSPKEKLWWERAQHKCEALGKRHPINSVGVQAEGTRTHSRRKREQTAQALLRTALKLHTSFVS